MLRVILHRKATGKMGSLPKAIGAGDLKLSGSARMVLRRAMVTFEAHRRPYGIRSEREERDSVKTQQVRQALAMVRSVCLACAIFLVIAPAIIESKTDPDTGRIRLLLIGAQWAGGNVFVTSLIRSDPRISIQGSVETSNGLLPEEVRRRARLSFPRTQQRFASTVDVLEYNFAPPWALSAEQQRWIRDSIVEEGLGLTLVVMGWHPCLAEPLLRCNRAEDWVNSLIYEAWPVDVVIGQMIKPSRFMDIIQSSPMVDLPDFEKQGFGPFGSSTYIGLVHARPGATVHTRWRTGGEDAIVSWRYGTGVALAIPVSGGALGDDVMRNWRYFIDFVLNTVYAAADVPVPDDPELSHSLRAAFQQFSEQKSLAASLIDFVDKFGANTRPLDDIVDDLEGMAREAGRLYAAGDYPASLQSIKDAMEGLIDLSIESTRVRNTALLWVYLTEWLTVSGTSVMCGGLIWTVMIRKRYYRRVGTTRLDHQS